MKKQVIVINGYWFSISCKDTLYNTYMQIIMLLSQSEHEKRTWDSGAACTQTPSNVVSFFNQRINCRQAAYR